MTRSRPSHSRHPARRSGKGRRAGSRLRILAVIGAVFAVGIGVGAGIGVWIAQDERPVADVALERHRPALEVPVRAYRPPVRVVEQPAPAPQEPPAVKAPFHDHPPEAKPKDAPAVAALPKDVPVVAVPPKRDNGGKPEPSGPPTRLKSSKTATWLANAVTVAPAAGRPMIAIVIDDLGIDQARTKQAIELPAPLTLAFIPYGYNLRSLASAGHAAGHELIVHVNMEPIDRGVDPGPHALLTSLPVAELRRRVDWALGQFDGFVGINNHMGSRFTEWPDGMEVVLQALRARGLLFLDSLTSTNSVGAALARAHDMPYAVRDIFLDHDQAAESVAGQLAETEQVARRNGHAIAIGHPHDVTLQALRDWLPKARAAGFQLVPLTAIVRSRRGEG